MSATWAVRKEIQERGKIAVQNDAVLWHSSRIRLDLTEWQGSHGIHIDIHGNWLMKE